MPSGAKVEVLGDLVIVHVRGVLRQRASCANVRMGGVVASISVPCHDTTLFPSPPSPSHFEFVVIYPNQGCVVAGQTEIHALMKAQLTNSWNLIGERKDRVKGLKERVG